MVTVTITSAQPLTKEQETKLVSAIEKKHKEKMVVETMVDPAVIGGLKVQVGSVEYDSTVSGKLAQLRQELMKQLS